MVIYRSAFLVMALLAITACAPTIPTAPSTITLAQPTTTTHRIQLQSEVPLKLDTGYTRTLASKSVWSRIGRVPQGDVYRPVGTIFTIEGRQVHEAYLVIQDKRLLGFYLPGEQNYSPLSTAVPMTFGEIE